MAEIEYCHTLIPIPPLPHNFGEDHAASFGIEMALIHNTFIRGLNSIITNAPLVKSEDEYAFAGYALSLAEGIQRHHEGEEEVVFPFLQKKLDMAENIEQHAAFHTGVMVFDEYMRNVQARKEKYDAEKTIGLLKSFDALLVQHLFDEIPTLSPERLAIFEKAEMDSLVAEHSKHVQSNPGFFTSLPFVMTHIDQKATPGWPPFPAPLRLFARYISGLRYRSYWKFSPFSFNGEPQKYA